jgi:thiol:disulfide interchange protein DsbC
MKKILPISYLFLILVLIFSENSIALTNDEATNILKELFRTEFKILEIKETPFEGFWEVVAEVGQEKMVIYINKDLRYIFHGQLLDRQTKRNLTHERLKELRKVDVSAFPLENAIQMGEGKQRLYIFTDPECYFCFQLHQELKLTKEIQAFLFLYPLRPTSYEKAKSIWCSQNRLSALEEVYQGKELKSPSCDMRPIDKNIELGRRLLIDSTPTIILQNGKIIEGYAYPNTLENILKSSSSSNSQ